MKPQAPEAMSQEQAADLAALQAAANVPQPGVADPMAPPAGPAPGTLQDAALLIGIARPILEIGFAPLRGAAPEAWAALHEPVAALMEHYGLNMGEVMTNPWARLALGAAPLAMHAYGNITAEQDKKPATESQALQAANISAPAPEAAPGQKTVIIGSAIPAAANNGND